MPRSYTLPTPAYIVAVEADNYRTKTFTLDLALDAVPGQFVMAWLPRFDEKPFSLVDADPVTLMVTAVGPFTRLVHDLAVGDRLWVRGPFGRGFVPAAAGQRPALIGGGYGVAPLLWLATQLADQVAELTTIIGARTAADVLYAARFGAHLNDRADARFLVTTEDGSMGTQGRVTDALAPLLAAGAVDSILACGPHAMLTALDEMGRRTGVPRQLSWEAYMRCAMGICGACEHDGTVLCLDGPVLAAG